MPYLTEPKGFSERYAEARRKAQIDLDNWPDSSDHTSNRDVRIIVCAGLTLAITILWVGMYYGIRNSNTGTPLPQTQSTFHPGNGL